MTFTSSEDLSFVIGAFLGDGSFVEDSAWHHHVKLAVRDHELAEAFNRSVAKVLGRKVNALTVTHDVGKVYYESKYSSRPLGLFLKGPLQQLQCFADDYPEMFLRGLFSADGGCAISMPKCRLRIAIELGSSNPKLLQMVESILLSHFRIRSITHLTRKKGSTWSCYGKMVILRKDAYQLRINWQSDVEKFVTRVGFVISRKQEAAQNAIHLIKTLGSSRAGEEWRAKYARKTGARWNHVSPIE